MPCSKKRIEEFIEKNQRFLDFRTLVIQIDRTVSTAAMTYLNGNYTMYINDEFISKYELTDSDILFIIKHELMHKSGGDLLRFFNNDMSNIDRIVANIVLDGFINSQILQRNSGRYGCVNLKKQNITLFDKLYDKHKFPTVFLYPLDDGVDGFKASAFVKKAMMAEGFPENDAEDLADLYLGIWNRDISVMQAYRRLRAYIRPSRNLYRIVFLGEACNEGNDCQVRYRGSDQFGCNSYSSVGSQHKRQISFKKSKQWAGVYEALLRAVSNGSTDSVRSIDYLTVQTPIPGFSRRGVFLNAFNIPEIFSPGTISGITNKDIALNVFIDVSGSFDKLYPFVASFIAYASDYTVKNIYQFSTFVKELDFKKFKKGEVYSSGGTDINPVLKWANKARMQKIIIFTDGMFGKISSAVKANLFPEIYTVLMKTSDNRPHIDSPITPLSQKTWEVTL